IVDVQALGYQKKQAPIHVTTNTKVEDITLALSGTQMDEVIVSAKQDIIKTELGKTVVHVRESMKAGNSLLDLLRNMPGVSVGADGSISITGKEGVVVLIDDKPVRLAGQELADYL